MRIPALAACLLLAGCSVREEWSMPTMNWFSANETTVTVEEVRRALVCNSVSGDAAAWMFPDLAAVRAWEAERGIALVGDEPLPEGPYALVEMGTRSSAGHGIAVSRLAARDGDVLILRATFVAPAPDRMVAQMITSPCVLVALPKSHFAAVEVIDQDGQRRARSGGGR